MRIVSHIFILPLAKINRADVFLCPVKFWSVIVDRESKDLIRKNLIRNKYRFVIKN